MNRGRFFRGAELFRSGRPAILPKTQTIQNAFEVLEEGQSKAKLNGEMTISLERVAAMK